MSDTRFCFDNITYPMESLEDQAELLHAVASAVVDQLGESGWYYKGPKPGAGAVDRASAAIIANEGSERKIVLQYGPYCVTVIALLISTTTSVTLCKFVPQGPSSRLARKLGVALKSTADRLDGG